jgi:hypothetical protein
MRRRVTVTSHAICDCPLCRRGVRSAIVAAYRDYPRWMGFYLIRWAARLGWVPIETYRSVIDEMLGSGQLLVSRGADEEYPRYLLSAIARPARKRGEK